MPPDLVSRLLRAFCIFAALFFGPLLAVSAEQGAATQGGELVGAPPGVPAERLALLSRGINISAWFSPSADTRRAGTWLTQDDAALIRRLGFAFVRLTASPQWLFSPSDPSTPPPSIRYYDHAVRLFLDAGLAVIV
ncbi:MAG TPA: hypothetical protein VL359_06705, partial [bacterium]|nr:hypothetical protein [bacterium]